MNRFSNRLWIVAAALFWGAGVCSPQAENAKPALMAYVGTFSSPLRDVLPTQEDLPPGNGRGIYLFRVDRTTDGLTP